MKRLIWLAILLPMVANATTAVTKPGYVACVTEQHLDDFVTYAVAKDTASMNALLLDVCIQLKGGLKVTIVDVGWTKTQFAIQGLKLWIPTEALQK